MTISALNKALQIASSNGLFVEEPMPVSEGEIEKLNGLFGDLPASYTRFLESFGTTSIEGIEFYGLVPGGFDIECIPNTAWLTRDLSKNDGLPNNLLVIEDLGGGAYACLALSDMMDNEAPIVLWETATSGQPASKLHRLAPSFGEYVLERVNTLLN